MKISFSPIRMDMTLTAEVAGNVLILNTVALDLSAVTETDPLEDHDNPWIVDPVRRKSGQLQLTLLLPHGAKPLQEILFPAPVTIRQGQVLLPPYDSPNPSEAEQMAQTDALSLSGEGRGKA